MRSILLPVALLGLSVAIARSDFAHEESPTVAPQNSRDRVAALNDQIHRGSAQLKFEPTTGYLRSVLAALNVPVESQVLVFSPTSSQAKLISAENPRAIYFTDDVAVAWVRGGSVLEIAANDGSNGAVFYTLDQSPVAKPQFGRNDACLSCHQSRNTAGVPGMLVLSTMDAVGTRRTSMESFVSDQRSPLPQRWGGWYVTGLSSRFRHMGNRIGQGWLESLYDQFDTRGYLTEYSDIVALMVLEHQTQAANLITRVASALRTEEKIGPRAQGAIDDLVDYLLFVDEALLPSKIVSTSGYAEKFANLGPRDGGGRSLRQFDLARRMMRYPCSYMIYSEAFDALPPAAKAAVYARLWEILSARSPQDKYRHLSEADREAVIEILNDTKHDMPPYFRSARE